MTSSLDATGSGLVLSGGDASQLFVIQGTGSLSLTGLTLTHGAAPLQTAMFSIAEGGAAFLDGPGSFTLTNGAITDSTANAGLLSAGGAIAAPNGSTLRLRNDIFSGNQAGNPSFVALGGAVYTSGGTVTIAGTRFTGNQAGLGAFLYGFGGGAYLQGSTIAIDSSTFNGNTAGGISVGVGGGLFARGRRRPASG